MGGESSKEVTIRKTRGEEQCSTEQMWIIARKLLDKDQRKLSSLLGLPAQKFEQIKKNRLASGRVDHTTNEKIVYETLLSWSLLRGENATKECLIAALDALGRLDLAEEVFPECPIGPLPPLKAIHIEIKTRQKQHLRHLLHLRCPRLKYLENNALPLNNISISMITSSKLDTDEEFYKQTGIREMFKDNEKENIRRILIEAPSGYGKTTLLLRLLADWAKGRKYMNDRFSLVFAMSFRNYKNSLLTHFLQQCCDTGYTEDQKLQAIEEIEERVLLLLDGFEDASDEMKDSLVPLLNGDEYPKMTVVVTCRTGCFQMNPSCLSREDILDLTLYKKIELTGISQNDIAKYIRNTLSIYAKNVDSTLQNLISRFGDDFKNPLLAVLSATVYHEMQIKSETTMTELYKSIFNFIIGHSLISERLIKKTAQLEVFQLQTKKNSNISETVLLFAKLCLEKLRKGCKTFERAELPSLDNSAIIFKLGFLNEVINFSHTEHKEYELIHKSFLEFFAAFYLSKANENEIITEIQELSTHRNPGESNQLFYRFLAGFLGNKASRLFTALLPWKVMKSVLTLDVNEILLEIPVTDGNLQGLEPYIPKIWSNFLFDEALRGWYTGILKYYQQTGIIRELSLVLPEEWPLLLSLPEDFSVDKIIIIINKVNFQAHDNMSISKGIRCKSFLIIMKVSVFQKLSALEKLLSNFVIGQFSLQCDCDEELGRSSEIKLEKHLELKANDFVNFLQKILDGDLKLPNLEYLTFVNTPSLLLQFLANFLRSLIHKKKITMGLIVCLAKGDVMEDSFRTYFEVISNAVYQNDLKYFVFKHNLHRDLPSNHLLPLIPHFSDDHQGWNPISVRAGTDWIEGNENQFNLRTFRAFQEPLSDESVNFWADLLIKHNDVKRLSCNESVLAYVSSKLSKLSWNGFTNIETLNLRTETLLDVSWFTCFRNLRQLFLLINCKDDILGEKVFIAIVSSLQSLKEFRVHSDTRRMDDEVVEFIKELSTMEEERNMDEVEVELHPFTDDSFCQSLEQCFLKNRFRKFSVRYQFHFHNDLIEYFIFKQGFKVSSEIFEEDDDDDENDDPFVNLQRNNSLTLKEKLIITYDCL